MLLPCTGGPQIQYTTWSVSAVCGGVMVAMFPPVPNTSQVTDVSKGMG